MKNNGNRNGSRGKRVARKFWMMSIWGMEHINIIPASRGMAPVSPKTCANPICAETNAFWELKLEDSPEAITDVASRIADEALKQARIEMSQSDISGSFVRHLEGLLDLAAQEYEHGRDFASVARRADRAEAVYSWSGATPAFTHCQVRARQVINAMVLPVSRPEALFQIENRKKFK